MILRDTRLQVAECMSKRQKFTPDFRAESLELVIPQKSLVEAAESLGTNKGTPVDRVRAHLAEHPEAETEEHGPVKWPKHENLKRELSEVNRENEFLKDVCAHFASKDKK